jgi:non-lysosomal glucosylceramidase
MTTRTFSSSAAALAFPLGGIGTGNVSLGARGDLRDWEIFNRSAKGTVLPNTFFALRTQVGDAEPVGRVLEGTIPPPYDKSHGFDPGTGAGLPRFEHSEFRGEYPFASIQFRDADVPLEVELEAYTPLIPLNPDDSGIPAAIFSYKLRNPTDQPVKITLVASMQNPVGQGMFDPTQGKRDKQLGHSINQFREVGDLRGLFMSAGGIDRDAIEYGEISIVTDHASVTAKPHWLRGGWWDFMREFWDDLMDDGALTDLGYTEPATYPDSGSVGIIDTIPAGGEATFRFVLAWYFPTRLHHWERPTDVTTHNHYVNQFAGAWEVAQYVLTELPRLEAGTRAFHDALFSSTLPPVVIDAVSANIVPLRSNTCFWLEDGRFFGWEGCSDTIGCCAGTCTHVWSYAYTVAYLFPSLEREMRRIEFNVETEPDGYMPFRTHKTFDPNYEWKMFGMKIAAVDGQMGSILRAYREWQLCGDKAWLGRMWDSIKSTLNYVNIQWDMDNDGVLEGRQHNTYDIEFYGPNPLCTFYYLAALKAVEAMAGVMGEPEIARRCGEAFQKGSARADALMWNGSFYIQAIDDAALDEHPYQHGKGCLSDQMLGVVHARALGLGDILPREHLHTGIKAVYDRNFRSSFKRHVNAQRSFVLNDEAGLLMCSWEADEPRPRFPFIYSDEVWTGVEYHVAAHLIYEGWLDEGLSIVQAVQDRHDGVRRNPWNEVECGHHYARSMSSWLVLMALTGFESDAGAGVMRFQPATDGDFKTFWSNGLAWGTLTQRAGAAPEVQVLGGELGGVKVFVGEREVLSDEQ